jgi:hypothetical protein
MEISLGFGENHVCVQYCQNLHGFGAGVMPIMKKINVKQNSRTSAATSPTSVYFSLLVMENHAYKKGNK